MPNQNDNSINAHISGDKNNININLPSPEKKESPNWLLRAIVGGIITIITSLCIYYFQNIGNKPTQSPEHLPKGNQIEGIKSE